MGCLKITHEWEGEQLENFHFSGGEGYEKSATDEKFCTDYTPFGAVAKQWNNPDQTQQEQYRHGYQGQYAEKDTTTGWNAFELRMYDPLIGRWLSVDPYRAGSSPYFGMLNRPSSVIDPDGGCPENDPDCWDAAYSDPNVDATAVIMMDEVVVFGMNQSNALANRDWSWSDFNPLNFWNSFGQVASDYDQVVNITRPDGFLESTGRVIVGATPMSVYDGAKVLITGENMYQEEATSNIDKGFAVLGVVAPIGPGKRILKNTTGAVIDRVNDVAGAVHDSGALNSLKE